MTRIGLLSDTHGYWDDVLTGYLQSCNEWWHGGDFGGNSVMEQMMAAAGNRPVRGVYGNIDGQDIRASFAEEAWFTCEGVKVFIKHIGGYPGRYAPSIKNAIAAQQPGLFISGHSHILKIMYDEVLNCLHINPGAAGKQGWHKVRTMVRFSIDGTNIKDCEVIEIGSRA